MSPLRLGFYECREEFLKNNVKVIHIECLLFYVFRVLKTHTSNYVKMYPRIGILRVGLVLYFVKVMGSSEGTRGRVSYE